MNLPGKASTPAPATPLRPYPDRQTSWLGRSLTIAVVLALAVAAGELAFYYRDGGAFPRVNTYVADRDLGVRLRPGATETLAVGGGLPTHLRINRDGYRGDDLPPPGPDDVLVVGDAQTFGLAVEDRDTFAAVLGKTVGKPVMNAGVPTYGPLEYRQVIVEQLAKRHPRTLIVALDLLDDLLEAQQPNKERSTVQDGWVVPKDEPPSELGDLPGHAVVARRSHLWVAFRRWRNATAEPPGERGAPTEASWSALVAAGTQLQPRPAGPTPAGDPPLGGLLRELKQLADGGGARLIVVILPLDLQTSPAAWKKYAAAPVDLEPSKAFTAALVELCHALGVAVLDATPVLATAGPGAFFDHSSYLTPAGHAAIAAALARLLTDPSPSH
jgi:hypothetical protein